MSSEVYVLVVRSDGSLAHMAFQTEIRGPVKPEGGWFPNGPGHWLREDNDRNILFELQRCEAEWLQLDGLTITSWRRLSQTEHLLFEQDREYRDTMEVVGDTIQHNIELARERHRALLRHKAAERLMILDRQWVTAYAKANGRTRDLGAAVDAENIADKRQTLLDLSDDPRIDAAQTLEDLKLVTLPDDDTGVEQTRQLKRRR